MSVRYVLKWYVCTFTSIHKLRFSINWRLAVHARLAWLKPKESFSVLILRFGQRSTRGRLSIFWAPIPELLVIEKKQKLSVVLPGFPPDSEDELCLGHVPHISRALDSLPVLSSNLEGVSAAEVMRSFAPRGTFVRIIDAY